MADPEDEERTAAAACWYLTGPTAGGKTAVSLELAELLSAEIVALDSMTVYQGMDIGTAKPTHEERATVSHHLIDVISPAEEFSLSRYVTLAHEKIREIQQRGQQVLFVGGTPLYLKAMLRGIFHGPAADIGLRQQLQDEAATEGFAHLHSRLREVDAITAKRLHPHDIRRTIRALEVYYVTGVPISRLQQQFQQGAPAEARKVAVLDWSRSDLVQRIDRRIQAMFELGLIEEVRALLVQHDQLSHTAQQAVGYREVLGLLRKEWDLDQATQRMRQRTRQFARRQETWFRSLSECRRVPCMPQDQPRDVAQRVLATLA